MLFFCTSDIEEECARAKNGNQSSICNTDFKTKKINWRRFTSELGQNPSSNEVVFNLAEKGLFSVKKGEQFIKFVVFAKYRLSCNHGGEEGEGFFLDKNNLLFARNTTLIW
mgnify:FL=1